MTKKKNYYYVLVFTNSGPVYVTSVDYSDKTAMWDKKEKPLEMGEYRAKDLAMGLCANFNLAVAVNSFYELDSQPYLYSIGEFEWKSKEEK